MGHNTSRSGYEKLVERLNKFPQGVPPSESLYQILKLLFSEEEAKLVSLLPIKPFTTKTASKAWKKSFEETSEILNELFHLNLGLETIKPLKPNSTPLLYISAPLI